MTFGDPFVNSGMDGESVQNGGLQYMYGTKRVGKRAVEYAEKGPRSGVPPRMVGLPSSSNAGAAIGQPLLQFPLASRSHATARGHESVPNITAEVLSFSKGFIMIALITSCGKPGFCGALQIVHASDQSQIPFLVEKDTSKSPTLKREHP